MPLQYIASLSREGGLNKAIPTILLKSDRVVACDYKATNYILIANLSHPHHTIKK